MRELEEPRDGEDGAYMSAQEHVPVEDPFTGIDTEKDNGKYKPQRGRLQPIPWTELMEEQGEPLIGDLLDCGDFSVVYGPSGCGKTFLALDMALHIALGWPWRGRDTTKRNVVYIAAESAKSIRRRVAAFHLYHGIAESKTADAFRVLARSVNLLDPTADLPDLIAGCLADNFKPALIIGDTISRLLAGGDENQSGDMGALVMNLDRLREETGAHLMGIHHTGKDTGRGARGWSGLRAAVDTEIEVSNTSGIILATTTKQRDLETDGAFSFRLKSIEVGKRANGKPITSCALMPLDAPQGRPAAKVTGQAKTALELLTRAIIDEGKTAPASNHIPPGQIVVPLSLWRSYCHSGLVTDRDNQDTKRRAFNRNAKKLQALGFIGTWDDMVWIAGQPGQGGTT